jgi:hypothetical protein
LNFFRTKINLFDKEKLLSLLNSYSVDDMTTFKISIHKMLLLPASIENKLPGSTLLIYTIKT